MTTQMEARAFSRGQKSALYAAAGGKCENCGRDLGPGWEADHDTPFSRGGPTDLSNGRALCRPCNQAKAARPGLRAWQRAAIADYYQSDGDTFLCVACPGAGKTTFALTVASELLRDRVVERVVVVVPTTHLAGQWSKAAQTFNLQLAANFARDSYTIPHGYHGAALSYSMVHNNCGAVQVNATRVPTLVILDEIHHCGRVKEWGEKCAEAFAGVTRRLALSGTPERSDNNPIPFVRYTDNQLTADFIYGYGDALKDGVCRPVAFNRYDSEVEWSVIGGGAAIERIARLTDDVSPDQQAERLRAALDPSGEFLSTLLREADEQLGVCRERGDEKAGGLVLARDEEHARAIHKLLGGDAVLAISAEAESSAEIRRYAAGAMRWIVAIKMVSEGVDIPRLRVLVYATNYRARTYFRQAVGRIVRSRPDIDEQTAYVFGPDDRAFLDLAQEIKVERTHALREMYEAVSRDMSKPDADAPLQMKMVVGFNSTPAELTGVTYDGDEIPASEYREVEEWRALHGLNESTARLAKALRDFKAMPAPAPATPEPDVRPVAAYNLDSERERMKAQINMLANKWAVRSGRTHQEANSDANAVVGLGSRKSASLEQLQYIARWLHGRLAESS